MQTNSVGYGQAGSTALENANVFDNAVNSYNQVSQNKREELSVEEEINKSAVQVSISMNAQIVLFSMDSSNLAKENSSAQGDITSFLSGNPVEGGYSLEDLGYYGKPITKLSEDEAKELIADEGFFGVEETSNRVADFVFDFAGYDLELLEKGRAGIVQGFDEAQNLWGGELPEISHQTQSNTLALIDARIADLKAKEKE